MEAIQETLLHYPLGSIWISVIYCHLLCMYFKTLFYSLPAKGTVTVGASIPHYSTKK